MFVRSALPRAMPPVSVTLLKRRLSCAVPWSKSSIRQDTTHGAGCRRRVCKPPTAPQGGEPRVDLQSGSNRDRTVVADAVEPKPDRGRSCDGAGDKTRREGGGSSRQEALTPGGAGEVCVPDPRSPGHALQIVKHRVVAQGRSKRGRPRVGDLVAAEAATLEGAVSAASRLGAGTVNEPQGQKARVVMEGFRQCCGARVTDVGLREAGRGTWSGAIAVSASSRLSAAPSGPATREGAAPSMAVRTAVADAPEPLQLRVRLQTFRELNDRGVGNNIVLQAAQAVKVRSALRRGVSVSPSARTARITKGSATARVQRTPTW